ncbi:MAG: hypothetical protein OXU77_17475 [Gammaproteobacteria bacterium]|nr:hypothetical protein [Gammaproteobacteria bacterium]MDE0444764.1 hypothetical protein [Gammaproteobacteria bacterium]
MDSPPAPPESETRELNRSRNAGGEPAGVLGQNRRRDHQRRDYRAWDAVGEFDVSCDGPSFRVAPAARRLIGQGLAGVEFPLTDDDIDLDLDEVVLVRLDHVERGGISPRLAEDLACVQSSSISPRPESRHLPSRFRHHAGRSTGSRE